MFLDNLSLVILLAGLTLGSCGFIYIHDLPHQEGRIPVEEDIAKLNLPAGTQASIAVYTDRVHVLSIVRNVVLRIKSWEHCVI